MLNRIRNLIDCLKSGGVRATGSQAQMNILDQYVTSAPSPQNVLDIFKGDWSSKLPGELADLRAGSLPLFEDGRIEWFVDQLGGVQGKTVLELGPLEAGHSYMLERLGAASIVAIEANTRAFLRCLIVKELLGLERVRFLCGDFREYLRANQARFDVCLASGVLYHMTNPVELIALLAQTSDQVCMWTHYYDHEIMSNNPDLAQVFPSSEPAEYAGFQHTLHYRIYPKAGLGWGGFCGGDKPFSCWLSREDILNSLEYFGFNEIRVAHDNLEHRSGPNFFLIAFRR